MRRSARRLLEESLREPLRDLAVANLIEAYAGDAERMRGLMQQYGGPAPDVAAAPLAARRPAPTRTGPQR
jgi:hypothetical protein